MEGHGSQGLVSRDERRCEHAPDAFGGECDRPSRPWGTVACRHGVEPDGLALLPGPQAGSLSEVEFGADCHLRDGVGAG
jgi:hypothetical protein